MQPIPHIAELSTHRSRLRERILLTVTSLGEATIGQISRATGIPSARVRWCLFGKPPRYRIALALVVAELLEEGHGPVGPYFVPTNRGRRRARSITSRRARRVNR